MTTLTFLYVVFICIFAVTHQLFFSHGQLIILTVFGALLLIRTFYIFEWGYYIFFYLGYELLRGFIPFFDQNVNILPMIKVDQFLFGTLPTVFLQNHFFNPLVLGWQDYTSTIIYIVFHFLTPFAFGLFLWKKNRKLFHQFALAFLILCYSAFITYLLFPAMPPWLASINGYIPPITQITTKVVLSLLPSYLKFSNIYSALGANPVAAIPSLHAAFPFLIFLVIRKEFPKLGFFVLIYSVIVWVAVLYLGEHYFIDILLGIIYSLIAYVIVKNKDFISNQIGQFINMFNK